MAQEIRFSGKTLDPATARAIADDVLVQGARPVDWWRRQGTDLHRKFMDTVRVSMENGEGIDKLRKRIGGGVISGVQVPGIMKVAKSNAEALARTATNKITNEARLRTFESNQDVVKGVKQVSTLDNRTSVICVAYDGQTWRLPDYQPIDPSTLQFNGGPPRHFNCRSTLVPTLKSWEELGLPFDELKPSTRASMDGQVPADQTFDAFLKKKGKTFQDKLLGPVRAKLWRTKKISLQEMLDFRGQPLSPDELAAIAKTKRAARKMVAATIPETPKPQPKPAPTEKFVVPDFKNSSEAEKWFAENMLRKGDNYGLGWIQSYDRKGLKIVAEVTHEMRQRFNMELPRYFGDYKKHPRYNFGSSRNALAAVHMDSDSLLSNTKGLNKKPNEDLFKRYSSESFKKRRAEALAKGKYPMPGEKFQKETRLMTEWFIAEAEELGDKALIKAAKQAAAAGNEFTAGDFTLTGWEDVVRKSFIHETGHRLHAQNLDEINRLLSSVGDPRKKYLWKRQVSEYAATNDKEWFAETFVHYIEGRHDRVYPPLLKWLKEHDRGL